MTRDFHIYICVYINERPTDDPPLVIMSPTYCVTIYSIYTSPGDIRVKAPSVHVVSNSIKL